jgi:hypothetical protein
MIIEPQPAIHLFGVLIEEPITTLTDLFVTAVCFYAFFRLSRIPNKNRMHTYLKIYFLSMGIATAVGGLIGHGFFYAFDNNMYWKLPGWFTSMISIAMIERASIEFARKLIKPSLGKFFAWLNIIELLAFMTITFSTLNFFFVEVHTAYGLLIVVTSFNLFIFLRTRSPGSLNFLIAIGFSSVSALVFMNEWGLHTWFNHYDISHVLMTFGAWFFYRGSMKAINNELAN